ncbi:MAG: glucans biosynthesis glucosyltransferase MdoH, partial [Candidatus Binatia bacterium]
KGAHSRVCAYLEALRRDGRETARLAAEAVQQAATRPSWPEQGDGYTETFAAVRRLLVARSAATETSGSDQHSYLVSSCENEELVSSRSGANGEATARDAQTAFVDWRVATIAGSDGPPPEVVREISRGSMVPQRIEQTGFRRRIVSSRPEASPATGRRRDLAWVRAARRRRVLLAVLVLIPSVIASGFMIEVLPHQGRTLLEVAIVLFFGALFGWISIGFWTALAGFLVLLFRRDRFAIVSAAREPGRSSDPGARTAVVMPICEEPVDRVFAGLQTIYLSLERGGSLEGFDFFVLSDTADPGLWVKEEEAWLRWCRDVRGFGRIFYRRRRVRVKRKSGNVADFCRRFGRQYRYMITLDADSVMSGDTVRRLVELMEARPDVGLIQTAPVAVHARSLYARIQQFANRVYGPLFTTGLHFWQLGDSQYWGHNAILRIAPFMEHCGLPRLSGRPPLGGEILSHDFVEAALMGRAGFSTWIAYDLPGSWEETPSSLLEDLQRDRRWCQGNLQHLRLVFMKGLFAAHRAIFLNGVLSYVSAMLWFAFLSLSTAEAILQVVREPDYFPSGPSLFPEWPVWRPDWAISLLSVTLIILFVPKILAALLVLLRGGARTFGGVMRFLLSIFLETVASSLLAPIRMVFHTKYVLTNLIGRTVSWRSPPRGDLETR